MADSPLQFLSRLEAASSWHRGKEMELLRPYLLAAHQENALTLDWNCGSLYLFRGHNIVLPEYYIGADHDADMLALARHYHPGVEFQLAQGLKNIKQDGRIRLLLCLWPGVKCDYTSLVYQAMRLLSPGGTMLCAINAETCELYQHLGAMYQKIDPGFDLARALAPIERGFEDFCEAAEGQPMRTQSFSGEYQLSVFPQRRILSVLNFLCDLVPHKTAPQLLKELSEHAPLAMQLPSMIRDSGYFISLQKEES